jgi:hypothetical protein
MKDLFRRALGCLGLALLWAGSACSSDETGLFIQGNVLRTQPDCSARAESAATLIGVGALDVALKLDYEASLLVASQLTPRGDKANLRTETMVTTIEGAEVHLYRDTGELDTEFTVPASGVISPSSGSDPGFGIINATLLPQSSGLALAQQITSRSAVVTRVAEVKVYGKTIGGLDVESATLRYVIRVCEGCLIDFPADVVDANGQCTLGMGTAQAGSLPCRPGQDDLVDCRVCASSNPYCASTAEGP